MPPTQARQAQPERPIHYWSSIAGTAAIIVLTIVAVKYLNQPRTLPDRVAALMDHVDPQEDCLGGEPSQERVRPGDSRNFYPDLVPRARSVVLVTCDYLGPATLVVEFSSRTALERAFSASRTARSRAWCIKGAGAFEKLAFSTTDFGSFCRSLHGTIRPEAPRR